MDGSRRQRSRGIKGYLNVNNACIEKRKSKRIMMHLRELCMLYKIRKRFLTNHVLSIR